MYNVECMIRDSFGGAEERLAPKTSQSNLAIRSSRLHRLQLERLVAKLHEIMIRIYYQSTNSCTTHRRARGPSVA